MNQQIKSHAKSKPARSLHHRRVLIIIVIMVSLILGYNVNDSAGLERSSSVYSITNGIRILLMGALSFVVISEAAKRKLRVQPGWVMLAGLYAFVIFSIFQTSAGINTTSLKQYYSAFEWIIISSLGATILNLTNNNSYESRSSVLMRFCQMLPVTTAIIVIFMAPINIRLSFLDGDLGRLGGSLIHPNKLSVLCALGVSAYLIDPKCKKPQLPVLFLVCVAVLTGSRSGIALTGFAVLHGLVGKFPKKWLPFLYFFLSALVLTFILIFSGFLKGYLSIFLSDSRQGGGLNNRDAVWNAASYMLSRRPYFGFGWLEGPALIGKFVNQSWWYARNAQNEFLNFGVASGLPAIIFIGYLYAHNLFVGIKNEFSTHLRFLSSSSVIIFCSALVEPVMSTHFNSVGLIFCATTILTMNVAAKQYSAKPSRRLQPTSSGSRVNRQLGSR